ncbi:hypothetical protein UCMB321_3795 [Pseudomonas batumici]|uniref:Uncharacterized protein n=1 Tax=Pseudomonas batumici TaxID=226910 RepID=A0A0C2HZE3_9PSED|nr:hypothetical protein UCMB321_3795 [Pseudomonas batumici]
MFVVATQVFQAAVGQPATEVTGAIHAGIRLGAERVVEETLCTQFGAVQVAPGNPGTTDIEFTDHTHRYRLATVVEHIELQVGNTLADRAGTQALGIFGLQRVIGHMHRGLGDAVHVYKLCSGVQVPGVPGLEHRRVQRFTAENHLAQRVRLAVFALGRNQLPECARGLVEDRDPGTAQQLVAILRRTADQLRHDQQATAMQQRPPDFPDREVEGERVEQRPDVLLAEAEPVLGRREQPCNVAMLNHHALGQAGGTGGVDHIGQMRGRQPRHLRITHGFVLQIRIVEIDDRHLHRRQGFLHRLLAEQRHRGAVAEGVGQALTGIGRVQRHVAGAGLEDAQQADDHRRAALDADRHPIVRAYAQGQQAMGHLVGPGVEFAVAQAFILIHQRHGLWPLGGTRLELLVDSVILGERLLAGIPCLQLQGFGGGGQRETANRQACIRQPLLQHVVQTLGHGLDLVRLEICLVVDVVQLGFIIVDIGPQMDGQRRLFVIVRALHRTDRRLPETEQMMVLFVGKRQVEQLRAIGAAQLQQTVEIADRETLTAVIALDGAGDALHQLGKRQLGRKLQAQHAELGEQPEGLLEAGIGAVEDRQADHQLIALVGPGETDIQRREQDMKTRSLQLLGQVVEAILKVPGKTAYAMAAAARAVALGLAVAREQQGFGDVAVLFQPVGLVPQETR